VKSPRVYGSPYRQVADQGMEQAGMATSRAWRVRDGFKGSELATKTGQAPEEPSVQQDAFLAWRAGLRRAPHDRPQAGTCLRRRSHGR